MATLHLVCGKIAAGKSTLTRKLAEAEGNVLISEDRWLTALFADQMKTVPDYVACAAKLRAVMAPHVADLLGAGCSVVLDFPANTVATRDWMRQIVAQTGVDHSLHYLDVPDEVCLARLHARNASGDHPFQVTDAQFHRITAAFEPPTPDEGFAVMVHRPEGA